MIYFCLSFSTNVVSITGILSFDISSMEQTGDKIKQNECWSGSDTFPLPFRRVFPEKQACVHDRVPGTPFCGYTSDIEGDRNQRIRGRAGVILKCFSGMCWISREIKSITGIVFST